MREDESEDAERESALARTQEARTPDLTMFCATGEDGGFFGSGGYENFV